MRLLVACLLLWPLAPRAALVELPAGAEIHIRLKTKVASHQSKAGDAVQAVVIAPVFRDGQMIIPAGATLEGKVKQAAASPDGERRARLELEFGQLAGAAAKPVKLAARVLKVDNARESVDEQGCVLGIQAQETLTAQMDRGLEKLGKRVAQLAEFLQVAKGAILEPAQVEIAYDAGSEMTLLLTTCIELPPAAEDSHTLTPIRSHAALAELVNRQPFQTMAEKPPKPSDLTNLMFIGSRERVEAAFAAAGWKTAAALNATSALETFRAIVEHRGYHEAPMSTLLLDGKKPDLVFQKQLNTFAMRHHLRIWKRPDAFEGQSVWVCAATHDIGIEFSPENRTFIHKIDSQIDRERAKVVNDLLLTGKVRSLALVERPKVPRESYNATGDKLETDGSMAVLIFPD